MAKTIEKCEKIPNFVFAVRLMKSFLFAMQFMGGFCAAKHTNFANEK